MALDVLDRVLPLVGVVLGALATFFIQRSQSGYTRRLAAADLLSTLRREVWSRSEPEGWINLQVYLGRLRAHLREVGVPEPAVQHLAEAAERFWLATEEVDEPEVGWIVRGAEPKRLQEAEARVHLWLRRTSFRARRDALAEIAATKKDQTAG